MLKNLCTILLVLASFTGLQAQSDFHYYDIKMETPSEYAANDSMVYEAANDLLNLPAASIGTDPVALDKLLFVMKWMSGTPDYSFSITSPIVKATKKDEMLLGIYLASAIKFAMENKEDRANEELMSMGALKGFFEYVQNPSNGVKPNKYLKKLIKAKEDGTLMEFLKKK